MITKFTNKFAILRDNRGIAAVEYALIAGLMATILIAVFPTLSGGLSTSLTQISNKLTTATK